ncbi:MAG: hypothetical protein ACK55I_07960, partial [bacterium]
FKPIINAGHTISSSYKLLVVDKYPKINFVWDVRKENLCYRIIKFFRNLTFCKYGIYCDPLASQREKCWLQRDFIVFEVDLLL